MIVKRKSDVKPRRIETENRRYKGANMGPTKAGMHGGGDAFYALVKLRCGDSEN